MEAVKGELPRDPFLLRKSVENYIGAKIESAYPEGRGISYVLKMKNPTLVQRLMAMKQLEGGFAIKVSKHPQLNFSKCVVSCQESLQYDDDKLLDNLREQGVREIRRIMRNGAPREDKIRTPTIILTIDGTILPKNIDFGWIRCRTRPYYPSPMLCYRCYTFGHTKAQCQKSVPTCGRCSQEHQIDPAQPCTAPPFCSNCKVDDHQVSSRKCPVYKKEEDIQRIRVDQGITYPAARRAYEHKHGNKSMAAVINASQEARFNELAARLDAVTLEMEKRDKKIDHLLKVIEEKDKQLAEKDSRIKHLEEFLLVTPSDRPRLAKTPNLPPAEELVEHIKDLRQKLKEKESEIATLRGPTAQKEENSTRNKPPVEKRKVKKKTKSAESREKNNQSESEPELSPTNSKPATREQIPTTSKPVAHQPVSKQNDQPMDLQVREHSTKKLSTNTTGKRTLSPSSSSEIQTRRQKSDKNLTTITVSDDEDHDMEVSQSTEVAEQGFDFSSDDQIGTDFDKTDHPMSN